MIIVQYPAIILLLSVLADWIWFAFMFLFCTSTLCLSVVTLWFEDSLAAFVIAGLSFICLISITAKFFGYQVTP